MTELPARPSRRRPFWPALFLLAIGACSAGLPEPSVADAERAQARFPGATLGNLSRGRSLYVRNCGGCHALKLPETLPPERWQAEVSEMRTKRGVHISDQDADLIVQYLWTTSARSPKQSASR